MPVLANPKYRHIRVSALATLVLLCLGIVTNTQLLAAEAYFNDCADALQKPAFAELSNLYKSKGKDFPVPDMCFRLNNNEFLVTVTNTGRIGQGLYYFNAKTGFYDFSDGKYSQGIQIKDEFIGPNGKRFVLLGWHFLHEGIYVNSFGVLNLVPRNKGKSFVQYTLIEASEDPVNGLCGESIKAGVTTSIRQYKVANANSEKIRLTFSVLEEDCASRKTQEKQKVFTLVNSRFTELGGSSQHPAEFVPNGAAGK